MSAPHRRLRKGAVRYRDHPNAPGDPQLGPPLLAHHFRASPATRAHADHHLVRAPPADLADAYSGFVPRAHRAGRPVVLIDNAREPTGRRLLESTLRDHTDKANKADDRLTHSDALRRASEAPYGRSPALSTTPHPVIVLELTTVPSAADQSPVNRKAGLWTERAYASKTSPKASASRP